MKCYYDFNEALADFRLGGGAMNYCDGVYLDESPLWQVGTYEEIAEVSTTGARDATVVALDAGGMSHGDILAELADWTEEETT